MVARAAIAAPALAPLAPTRRQPRHPGQPSRQFQPLESSTTPRCDDRLSSGHHRRLIRRPPLTVLAIHPVERAQVHLLNSPEDRPHQVIVGYPLRQIRRHQHRLPPITSNEVLWHPPMVLNPPDSTAFTRQPPPTARLGADSKGSPQACRPALFLTPGVGRRGWYTRPSNAGIGPVLEKKKARVCGPFL